MPSSTTELIKSKLDVVDFLRGYLQLQPAGKNFKALCPFHKEKTPSFMISPDRQSWHCFGCGIGGDIFGFLMRYENLEFGEALRVLAEKAGVELRRVDPAEHKFTGLLYELNDKAKEFFTAALKNFTGGKQYLADRGLQPVTIEEFELGWAPNEPEALSMYLLNRGYAPDDILRAGLAIKTERGMFLDRFRGRIMFPIHNHFGRVVGFTGRIFPPLDKGDTGKYVNSPETPIFQKSRLLYGFWKSKNFIHDLHAAFLVEGQMDFLMSWQAGVKNTVATSGTALTPDHLRVLHRLTDELILSFDSDAAGSAAAERAIDLAEENDLSVKVVECKNYKDPAEAAQAGSGVLLEAIEKAVPAPQFYFEKYLPKTPVLRLAGREDIRKIRIVLGKIKAIASPIGRSFWLRELAKRTSIEERILAEEAEKIVLPSATGTVENEAAGVKTISTKYSRRELIGERLLRAAVAKNDFKSMDECVVHLAPAHKNILELLRAGKRRSDDPALDELLNFIVLGSADASSGEIGELKTELAKENFKDRRLELAARVKRAEENGDEAGARRALEELGSHLQNTQFS